VCQPFFFGISVSCSNRPNSRLALANVFVVFSLALLGAGMTGVLRQSDLFRRSQGCGTADLWPANLSLRLCKTRLNAADGTKAPELRWELEGSMRQCDTSGRR
jgi:hypothetical protein